MKDNIINNLFGLWEHLGKNGQFLNHTNQYNHVQPHDSSWPNKVFGLNASQLDVETLYTKIARKELPNSVSLLENSILEEQLFEQGFSLRSSVKGMYLDLKEMAQPNTDFTTIERVNNTDKAKEFARIASAAFGYTVGSATILSNMGSPSLKAYIGSHQGVYASCGMVFLDKNKVSGLHMIGTVPTHRGAGLGKTMTNKLLAEAFKNGSTQVVLVASESGERIYNKLGFKAAGALKSYGI